MTAQDIQDRLDAIVVDLQTKGKGRTVQIMFRVSSGAANILPLSSDANGVVNAAQLAVVQNFVDNMAGFADDYSGASIPVSTALEAFKTAQAPHEALMTTATNARKALQTALDADEAYQTAKTAADNARANVVYTDALQAYKQNNISENYAELQAAKGSYVY